MATALSMQPQAADKVAELRVRAATASANLSRAEKEAPPPVNGAALSTPSASPPVQPSRRTVSLKPYGGPTAAMAYEGDDLDSDTEDAANVLEDMAMGRSMPGALRYTARSVATGLQR